jgi:hypothetical protein
MPFKPFFAGLIDYAGLFPPALLPLDQALKNYAKYIKEEDNWILAKFILPAAKLNEIEGSLFSVDTPLKLSLITQDLKADLELALSVAEKSKGRIKLEALETKVSAEDLESFSERVGDYEDLILAKLDKSIPIFYELSPSLNWQEDFKNLVVKVADFRCSAKIPHNIKIRTGGIKPNEVPDVETP